MTKATELREFASLLTVASGQIQFDTDIKISGDLITTGNTINITADTLNISDPNITLASGAANSAVADGAGITIDGADATLTWVDADSLLEFNKNIRVGTYSVSTHKLNIATNTAGDTDLLRFYAGGTATGGSGADLKIWASASQINFTSGVNDNIQFQVDDGDALKDILSLKQDGNVGIGETNPLHKLHVKNDGGTKTVLVERAVGSNAANLNEFSSFYSLSIKNRSDGSYLNFGGNSSRTDIQATDGAVSASSKAIHLNPFGGNVGIGTGTTAPAAKFNVTGSASGNWISIIENTHNSNGNGLKVLAGDNADTVSFRVSTYNNSTLFNVRGDGEVTATRAYNTDLVRHSIAPTLNLDFANSKQLDPRITFYRDSIATYYDSKGVLRYANHNEPRFDHDPDTGESKGLLIEEQATNYITFNNYFHLSGWGLNSGMQVIPNYAISPDGKMNATRVIFSGASQSLGRSTGITWSGQTLSAGVWIKGTSGETISIAVGGTDTFHTLNGEWQRIEASAVAVNSSFNINTFSGMTARDILVFGAQLEDADFTTSYIPSDTRFTSRSSVATYYDETGILRTAPVNSPRYGYKYDGRKWVETGLILENAATNYLPVYPDLVNRGSAVDLVLNSTTAPDGSNAHLFKPTTTSTLHRIGYYSDPSLGTGNICFSVYMKAGGYRYVALNNYHSGSQGAGFDLETGTITAVGAGCNAFIEEVTNGWYRCGVSYVTATTNDTPNIEIRATSGGGYEAFAGNGTSGIYAWGLQMENSLAPSSYIYTTDGSTATRSTDVASSVAYTRDNDIAEMNNAEDVIGQQQGTVFTEWSTNENSSGFGGVFELWDSGTNGIDQRFNAFYLTDNYSVSYGSTWESGDFQKTALAYDSTSVLNSRAASNGALQSTDTSHTWNLHLTKIRFGSIDLNPVYQLNGHLARFRLYSERLSDAELQALTENN